MDEPSKRTCVGERKLWPDGPENWESLEGRGVFGRESWEIGAPLGLMRCGVC